MCKLVPGLCFSGQCRNVEFTIMITNDNRLGLILLNRSDGVNRQTPALNPSADA